jgi:hypothetical protein
MEKKTAIKMVKEIMVDFARKTGLEPANTHPKRYLWTDAFAVCNYLELFRQTNEQIFQDLALHLVDQVHHILGQHRDDNSRKGWISSLDEYEGEQHPTLGGLRIGKKLKEHQPDETPDESQEWDRDGQYYHYLTKWMHALNRVSRVTGDPTYSVWAIELAQTAHAKFTYSSSPDGQKMMYWKMSIDLSYPLVPSMGQHDPLDGFITYNELQITRFKKSSLYNLKNEIMDISTICQYMNLTTDDPLGIGGLLSDALRIVQLMIMGSFGYGSLLEKVINSALIGLNSLTDSNFLKLTADYRLAFRELGLSIGLKGVQKLKGCIDKNPKFFKNSLNNRVDALNTYSPLINTIQQFWMDDNNMKTDNWTEHQDINLVMLANSLLPDGFLLI